MESEWSLSIVIPAFNRERRIALAIRSALNQTVAAEEIIVVDDGSTDRTSEVAKSFGSQVRVVSIENNGTGPARPRNVGIGSARTSHIMFLDSDDFLEPHIVERHRDALRSAPGVGLVCSNYFIQHEGVGTSCTRFANNSTSIGWIERRVATGPGVFLISSTDAYRQYCRGNFLRFAATLPRWVCTEVGGFSEALTPSEDVAFFFRVLSRHDLIYIDEPLHTYVHHTDNISGARIDRQFRDHVSIRMLQVLEYETTLCQDAACRSALEGRIVQGLESLAYHYRTNGLRLRDSAIREVYATRRDVSVRNAWNHGGDRQAGEEGQFVPGWHFVK